MCNYWDKFPELQWLCQFEDAPGNQDGAYFKPHTQTPCFVRAPTIFQPRTPSMTIAFCMSTGLSLSLYQSLCTGPVCLAWTPSIATFSVTAVLMQPCQTTNRSPFYWQHLLIYVIYGYLWAFEICWLPIIWNIITSMENMSHPHSILISWLVTSTSHGRDAARRITRPATGPRSPVNLHLRGIEGLLPSGCQNSYWKSPFLMGKSTINSNFQ